MILAILALVTATFQPAAPKVGDLITVDFPAPAVLDASPDYEVVSRSGKRVVIRTFVPKPLTLSGKVAGVPFRNLRIPVHSVLKGKDDLQPAPLAPPRPAAYPRLPFILIAAAALCAFAAWCAVWWRGRAGRETATPMVSPEQRFRDAVLALRRRPAQAGRWAVLADETRKYLAATRPRMGSELTTSEMLPRLGAEQHIVAAILRQGDLEKFSPRGANAADFDELAGEALSLAIPQQEAEAS